MMVDRSQESGVRSKMLEVKIQRTGSDDLFF
jgi:hypothetical protein